MKNNCAFQYWNGRKIIVDEVGITLNKAKELFNEYYDDMLKMAENNDIEVAIWINMKDDSDYHKTLVHIYINLLLKITHY